MCAELDIIARDMKKKRFYLTYRYNIIEQQKLNELKESEYFKDYTEILDAGVSVLYDILINKKLPDYIVLIAKKTDEENK